MIEGNDENRNARLKELIRHYHNLPDPWKDAYTKWRIQRYGRKFEVRRYGLCQWKRVVFRWMNGRQFYKLVRVMPHGELKDDEHVPRSEYFKGRLIRRYVGRQTCFVEFCELLWKNHRYPSSKKFFDVVKALGLDEKTANKYVSIFQQCFPPK